MCGFWSGFIAHVSGRNSHIRGEMGTRGRVVKRDCLHSSMPTGHGVCCSTEREQTVGMGCVALGNRNATLSSL